MGDGGSANDPLCNGQRDDTLLGKLLRIDVNQNVNTPPFYGIPPSNPFAAPGGPLDEIWAKGLRNPWRFSFDRVTGDLFIADVGQSAREEIDFQPRTSAGGDNYGWKSMEGSLCGEGGSSGCPAGVLPCNSPAFKAPLYEYAHAGSGNCTGTVIGGYVYRGTAYPDLAGVYFYGDYCFGWLFGNGQRLTPLVPQLTTRPRRHRPRGVRRRRHSGARLRHRASSRAFRRKGNPGRLNSQLSTLNPQPSRSQPSCARRPQRRKTVAERAARRTP
jgi:hypothetical protein